MSRVYQREADGELCAQACLCALIKRQTSAGRDVPVGDAAPGSHRHAAATAAAAFAVRTPRVPVIHAGHLDARRQVTHDITALEKQH